MTNWEQCTAVERDPDKVSGAWVFRETRVPVSALFENLKDGATVEQFLISNCPRLEQGPRWSATVRSRPHDGM